LDEGKVVGGVVARRDSAALFDPVEKSFDLIASAVEIWAKADRIAAIAFRGMLAHTPFFKASSLIQSASMATLSTRLPGAYGQKRTSTCR
jgi:hypothetical protein